MARHEDTGSKKTTVLPAGHGPSLQIGGSGRLLTRVQFANSVNMAPGLRELIALPPLAGLGRSLALAQGDLLFVAFF
jgi:hypothetical protein